MSGLGDVGHELFDGAARCSKAAVQQGSEPKSLINISKTKGMGRESTEWSEGNRSSRRH